MRVKLLSEKCCGPGNRNETKLRNFVFEIIDLAGPRTGCERMG